MNSSHPRSVGVGYSYADFGETVETTEEAARNVHAFLTIFFETFKQFAGRPLHLSGESYAVSRFFRLGPMYDNMY
jgi:carboxypeptidase C (cathepsin A)